MPTRPYEEVIGSTNPNNDPDLKKFSDALRDQTQAEYRENFMESEIAHMHERIAELGSFEQGWLDGGGEAVSPEALRVAETLTLEIMTRGECGWPVLFPTEEGGVQLQWQYNEVLYTVYVKPNVTDFDIFIMEIAKDIPASKHYGKQGVKYDEIIPYLLAPREDSIHE